MMTHATDEASPIFDITSVMDDAVDLIMMMTCKGQLLYLNGSARQFLRTQADYQQAKLVEFISYDNYQQILTKAMPTAVEQGHWSGTIVLQNTDNQDLPVSITLMPHASGQDGDCPNFSIIARDITNHHMMETMLVQLLEKEREMNEIKNNFLELLSHEFRNPLSVINTSAEIIEHYGERVNPIKHLGKIRQSVKRLNFLLDRGVVLMRMSMENKPPDYETVNLDTLCQQTLEQITGVYPERTFQYQNNSNCDRAVIDYELTSRALQQLLVNAITYSEDVITLLLTCTPEGIQIQVHDRGIGVPDDEQQDIFTPFFRGRAVASIPGMGLGLTLVQAAIEKQRGQITVESIEGEGSIFTMHLPAK